MRIVVDGTTFTLTGSDEEPTPALENVSASNVTGDSISSIRALNDTGASEALSFTNGDYTAKVYVASESSNHGGGIGLTIRVEVNSAQDFITIGSGYGNSSIPFLVKVFDSDGKIVATK